MVPRIFEGVEIVADTLSVYRRVQDVKLELEIPEAINPREEEAFECLALSKPKRRMRGLKLLAELGDVDLFDWCAMQ